MSTTMNAGRPPAVSSTPGILQDLEPGDWARHRFGLPAARWKRLEGRCYWITGAGTGYGRALTAALAAAGAHVFLTGRRREKLEETLGEVRTIGGSPDRCVPVPADVADAGQAEEAARRVAAACPALHGLVHGAALPQLPTTPWPLQEESPGTWDRMMRINVAAPWNLTRLILPHLLRGGEPRVLFLTSEAGWAGTPGFGMYNVSKAALNSLGLSLAEECAARHPGADVQINVLVPGEARTEMNQGSAVSPYALACMALALLSYPRGGPNGRFFHRDGRHVAFGAAAPFERPLLP